MQLNVSQSAVVIQNAVFQDAVFDLAILEEDDVREGTTVNFRSITEHDAPRKRIFFFLHMFSPEYVFSDEFGRCFDVRLE